jgi:tagatose-1,6-bisphosphate aldolase non-catalytic subunit AgaZ/GatZ
LIQEIKQKLQSHQQKQHRLQQNDDMRYLYGKNRITISEQQLLKELANVRVASGVVVQHLLNLWILVDVRGINFETMSDRGTYFT